MWRRITRDAVGGQIHVTRATTPRVVQDYCHDERCAGKIPKEYIDKLHALQAEKKMAEVESGRVIRELLSSQTESPKIKREVSSLIQKKAAEAGQKYMATLSDESICSLILDVPEIREEVFNGILKDHPHVKSGEWETCGDCQHDEVPVFSDLRRDAWRWDPVNKKVIDDPSVTTDQEVSCALTWKRKSISDSPTGPNWANRTDRLVPFRVSVPNLPKSDRDALVAEWKAAGSPRVD